MNVEVIDGEQLGQTRLEPALFGQRRTLGTVPVAAGAPDGTLGATVLAHLAGAPERRGAAAFDGPQGGELSAAQLARGPQLVARSAWRCPWQLGHHEDLLGHSRAGSVFQ